MGGSAGPQRTQLDRGAVTYEAARVVITPEGPFHYAVTVSQQFGERTDHAVEHIAINATTIHVEDTLWFHEADIDIGIPLDDTGETAWIWA